MNRHFVTLARLAIITSLGLTSISLIFSTAVQADDLALAKKSGCMACHSIEKKIVGPAWKDVAAKYKGTKGVRDMLIGKVKKGGKGNWTKITGGAPMPPYSPRVSDADIGKLVDFLLDL